MSPATSSPAPARKGRRMTQNPSCTMPFSLALYTDILERKGLSAGRRAFVWDIHGKEVPYDFEALYGKRNPTNAMAGLPGLPPSRRRPSSPDK